MTVTSSHGRMRAHKWTFNVNGKLVNRKMESENAKVGAETEKNIGVEMLDWKLEWDWI